MSLRLEMGQDPPAAAQAALDRIEAWGGEALAARGRYILSLAGGSTPRLVYELWGEKSRLDWTRVELIYGDERCVPPEHPDSNHGMVRRALLAKLEESGTGPRVHPMDGAQADPARAAADYEALLEEVVGPARLEEARIDVALLGIGADGHTASMFPGAPALDEARRRGVATEAPGGQARLTLTFTELRRARRLLFLAVGDGKADILREVLEGELAPRRLPSQTLVRDDSLESHLVCDRAAAVELRASG